MKIIIEAEPKEIADLIVALQGQLKNETIETTVRFFGDSEERFKETYNSFSEVLKPIFSAKGKKGV